MCVKSPYDRYIMIPAKCGHDIPKQETRHTRFRGYDGVVGQ